MAATFTKRQQARNERALQDLIKNVPGNDKCADCGARNPGWASWSLGVFLCMRCAALHRKLGTHISRVKSLSMDKWDANQVENMKRIGNTESNRRFNPRNVKPQIPVDVDEVDGAMERFIRQKYEQRAFSNDSQPSTRQNTGSTGSTEDHPPPLPPKPTKRFNFGLRASSSTFPTSRSGNTPPSSPGSGRFGQEQSPPRVSKPSRVFGSNIERPGDSFDSKLNALREMGFTDDKRNSTVLRGLNGNLDKTVETLIRLGEGNSNGLNGHTPTPPAKPSVNGISIDSSQPSVLPRRSTNPFDNLDAAPPQTAPHAPSNSYNPFLSSNGTQPQQTALDQAFQNMQVSQPPPQQQLFPNRTGGHGVQNGQGHFNPFQAPFMPPPVPQIPAQYQATSQQNFMYTGQAQQQQQQQYGGQGASVGGNPFLRSTKSQIFAPSNPFNQQTMPFQNQQQHFQVQQHMQPQNSFQQLPPTQSSAFSSQPQQPILSQPMTFSPQQEQNNPFFQTQTQQPQPQPQQQQQQQLFNSYGQQPQLQGQNQSNQYQQQAMQQPYQFAKPDKSSILALYNYPQLAPARPAAPEGAPASGDPADPNGQGKGRSVTMPVTSSTGAPTSGTMNPFAPTPAATPGGLNGMSNGPLNRGKPHVSQESVDFSGLMNGRHSPDAFSGLSSTFR